MISALTGIPFDDLPLKPQKVKKEMQIPPCFLACCYLIVGELRDSRFPGGSQFLAGVLAAGSELERRFRGI